MWLDANLSPSIANWIRNEYSIRCFSLRDLGLRDAGDTLIFKSAKTKGDVVLITRDEDFCQLLYTNGPPPKIVWLTFGNCSNAHLKEIFKKDLLKALAILGENDLVEISNA